MVVNAQFTFSRIELRNPDHCCWFHRRADRDAWMSEFGLGFRAPFQVGESGAGQASIYLEGAVTNVMVGVLNRSMAAVPL